MATAFVVDDEPGVRALVSLILRRYGFAVIEAADVDSAAKAATEYQGSLELLIVDHALQNESGQQVIAAVKHVRPDIEALQYSGHTREQLLDIGALAPDDAFLQKPFTPNELVAKVTEVLGYLPERQSGANA